MSTSNQGVSGFSSPGTSGASDGTKGGSLGYQTDNIPSEGYKPQTDVNPDLKPDVYNEFKPEKRDDNMMAENTPIERGPDHFQAGTQKDINSNSK
jgi:hypothetical protein